MALTKDSKKLDNWTSRWLSLGGRLLIITSILQCVLVYWFYLLHVPGGVIVVIRRVILCFIWRGKHKDHKFHLVSWEVLSKPKFAGRWGIKNLRLVNMALCAKSFWRALFNEGLWGKLVRSKYLSRLPIIS